MFCIQLFVYKLRLVAVVRILCALVWCRCSNSGSKEQKMFRSTVGIRFEMIQKFFVVTPVRQWCHQDFFEVREKIPIPFDENFRAIAAQRQLSSRQFTYFVDIWFEWFNLKYLEKINSSDVSSLYWLRPSSNIITREPCQQELPTTKRHGWVGLACMARACTIGGVAAPKPTKFRNGHAGSRWAGMHTARQMDG